MDINFTNMANNVTDAVGKKAADYRDSVRSAYRVYELQNRIKGMLKQGLAPGDIITAILPNVVNADEVGEKLVQGVNALEQELQKEDYDWRSELNRVLADKNEPDRARYLINLILAFNSFYNGDINVTAQQAERINRLDKADVYTVDDIRFLTDVLENQIDMHSDFLARASLKVMSGVMEKLTPEMIDKIMKAYEFDALSRAIAMYVAQQTGELHAKNGMDVGEIPPELLGQLAAAQTESSKMMLKHWKFGVMMETLKHDVKRIIGAMFHYIATHIEGWITFALGKAMFVTFAIALLGFVTYLFGVTPISLIIVGLVLIGFWKDRDFDKLAVIIIDTIKKAMSFISDLFAKAKPEASIDPVSEEAEDEKTEDEEAVEEEAEDEGEEVEEDEQDEVHA